MKTLLFRSSVFLIIVAINVHTHIESGKKCEVSVTELVHAPSFDELFRKIDLTKSGWPTGTTPQQASADMAAYYDKEEESRVDTVAIGVHRGLDG